MTDIAGAGTSGGSCGTNRARRRLALALAAGFLTILVMITIGNAESMLSDFAADGVRVTAAHVWTWQVTSVLAWLAVTPLVWRAVARVRPPRFGWGVAAVAFVVGLPIASACHIGLMILFRAIAYAAAGEHYRFQGALAHPYLYEFRKDIATYLQFVGLAALCQWLLARAGEGPVVVVAPAPAKPPRAIEVPDGARTLHIPVAEIASVAAAGNYVELMWHGRAILHRATLAAMEAELGPAFARIHRGRLVRRDAIRAVEVNQAGDFEVVLADGARVRGSRRYREGLG